MNFYQTSLDRQELRQGDIVGPIPFVAIDLNAQTQVVNAESQSPAAATTVDISKPLVGRIAALLPIEWSLGMIVTQCCDLGIPKKQANEKPVMLARVTKMEMMASSPPLAKIIEKIREYQTAAKSPSIFYLPENTDPLIEKSTASLLLTVTIPPRSKPRLRELLKLRLTDVARQALQERLAYCFGRFGAPDSLYFNSDEFAELNKPRSAN